MENVHLRNVVVVNLSFSVVVCVLRGGEPSAVLGNGHGSCVIWQFSGGQKGPMLCFLHLFCPLASTHNVIVVYRMKI